MQTITPLQIVAKLTAAIFLLLMGQGCVVVDGFSDEPVAEQNQLPSEPALELASDKVIPTFTPSPEAPPPWSRRTPLLRQPSHFLQCA